MPLPFELADIEIAPLSEGCRGEAFSCGDDTVDKWFQIHSQKRHEKYKCRVKVVCAPGDDVPVAWYSISMQTVNQGSMGKLRLDHLFTTDYSVPFPALSLDWIAVRKDLRGNGLGRHLMGVMINEFYFCIEEYCFPAMVLEAIDQRTEDFYHSLGFRRYGYPPHIRRTMIIGAKPVVELRLKMQNMLANEEQQA